MSTNLKEQSSLLSELTDETIPSARRLEIGDRLATMGDHRKGIGLDAGGVPDVVWCQLPHSYAIAKYPITCAQMQAFYDGSDGFRQDHWWEGLAKQKKFWEQNRYAPNLPAENMDWYTAVAFTRWLSHKLGYEVRLPTEAEWWYAASGGDPRRIYPWGPQWNSSYANTHEAGLGRVTAVGMFPGGTAFCGAMDMGGNIWEWSINEFKTPSITDTTSGKWKPVRGGAFYLGANQATTTSREYFSPINQFAFTGFRLIRPTQV
ncbi:MAG TPA: SUMF1/EgtB/PvdO family nonheme iron enzyme [Streptosporangiaceae bacterium]|jgi:formylglycine-generating enzyme required for sulfatase activity